MNVKLRKDKIFVVCRDKIYVFNLSTFKNMDTLETGDNSHGIVGVSFVQEQTILAYPDKTKGHVRIKNYEKSSTFSIKAHENNISYISVSYDGNLIATASEQGTLIRIFETESGDKLQEIQREDKADIMHICFSSDYRFLAASNSKGTIHIWSLAPTLKKLIKSVENEIENKKSELKLLPGFLGGDFFGSELSFAKVRITDHRSICCFGSENSIIIVSTNGKYYKAEIDLEKGGDCKIIEEQQLLQ
jgi:WD40 repeat protein